MQVWSPLWQTSEDAHCNKAWWPCTHLWEVWKDIQRREEAKDTHGVSQGNYMQKDSITKCVGDKNEFKCENCPAVFSTAGNLKAHITNKSSNAISVIKRWKHYLEKDISSVHIVKMEVVKTIDGHLGLFPSTELQKDLHCSLCDFKATCAARLRRHMIHHNPNHCHHKRCTRCDDTLLNTGYLDRPVAVHRVLI